MTFVVETGAGLAGANAYAAVTVVDEYHVLHGNSAWANASEKEAAIVRASAYLTTAYQWPGERLKGRGQGLAWPRSEAHDNEGNEIPDNEVPSEVIAATAELALREMTTPGFLSPDVTLTERITMEKIGDIAVEYADTPVTASASKPVITVVNGILAPLLSNTGLTTFLSRA